MVNDKENPTDTLMPMFIMMGISLLLYYWIFLYEKHNPVLSIALFMCQEFTVLSELLIWQSAFGNMIAVQTSIKL